MKHSTAYRTASIFDLTGRTVITKQIPSLSSGNMNWNWDGKTQTGDSAPSGVYLAVLSNGDKSSVYKFSLLK